MLRSKITYETKVLLDIRGLPSQIIDARVNIAEGHTHRRAINLNPDTGQQFPGKLDHGNPVSAEGVGEVEADAPRPLESPFHTQSRSATQNSGSCAT